MIILGLGNGNVRRKLALGVGLDQYDYTSPFMQGLEIKYIFFQK